VVTFLGRTAVTGCKQAAPLSSVDVHFLPPSSTFPSLRGPRALRIPPRNVGDAEANSSHLIPASSCQELI
jgi:hypothetical protein